MSELSPAAQAVLKAMRRSFDHEPTRRAIASEMLWVLSRHLPIQELTRQPPDEFELGLNQGQHLSRAWLEQVSEELRTADLEGHIFVDCTTDWAEAMIEAGEVTT